ncbi:MAG: carbohydrate binding domain-containing protein [Bacteroidota bacterium]
MKRTSLLLSVCLCLFAIAAQAQCPDTLISNGGFEMGMSDWWTWHGGDQDAHSFEISDDAFMGDSAAVINVLEPADSITGGAAEYNNRSQVIPVVGGDFYEISLAAKSTLPNTEIRINVKDEFDSWATVYTETFMIDTAYSMISGIFQADVDRADVHVEIAVYNGGFQQPYSVTIDAVCMSVQDIATNTCADNLVANPGFETGAGDNWWNWHSNNPTAYSFETGSDAYLGDSSALIRVLVPSDQVTGPAEINSRPQVSAIADSQNYKITFFAKSSEPATEVVVWLKDEFDGWTTIHTETMSVDTIWGEHSTVFTADADRADVHLEFKVYNETFSAPYDVWIDEVSICTTSEEPGGGDPGSGPDPIYGSLSNTADCANNLAPGNDGFEVNDTTGWDIWDGSDMEELATINVDPVLPYTGTNSARIDIFEDNNTAEFHHRFGPRITLEDGKDYTLTMWIRSNVPAGDTVDILARTVRDTDWTAQSSANFYVLDNTWMNYQTSFTADGNWNNAFVELKIYRKTAFNSLYSVWFDDIELCTSDSVTSTGLDDIRDLGLLVNLYPNPVSASVPANLELDAERLLQQTNISMVDMLGRTVWQTERDIFPGLQRVEIPTGSLTAGVYIVKIQHQGYVQNLKLQLVSP